MMLGLLPSAAGHGSMARTFVTAFALPFLALLAACPSDRPPIECVDNTSCGLAAEGECRVNPETGHQFCAYPDGECPSGYRWSDYDVEEPISGECYAPSPIDAGTDGAPPDGAIQARFDVGYVSEWVVGGEPQTMTEYEWIRIVNMGSAPLDLTTGRVTNIAVSDDRFPITATWQTVTTVLDPGKAAGRLSTRASPVIVSNGLVSEPAQDAVEGLLQFRVASFPPSGAWFGVQVEITIEIGNARATLPLVVGNSGTNPTPMATQGARVSSVPVP